MSAVEKEEHKIVSIIQTRISDIRIETNYYLIMMSAVEKEEHKIVSIIQTRISDIRIETNYYFP